MQIRNTLKILCLIFSLLAFCCGLTTLPAFAQYQFTSWTTDSGLPQNSINAILQTRDGYLWLATFDGLVRYNGAQFTVFNHTTANQLPNQRFDDLLEDADGNLWIHSDNDTLTRYREGQFTIFTTEQGLPDSDVLSLGKTADGNLLARTQNGLACFRNGRFEIIPPDPMAPQDTPGKHKRAEHSEQASAVWYRREKELRRVSQGRVTTFQVSPSEIKQLYEDRQGWLWIGTSRRPGLAMFNGDGMRVYTSKDGLPPAPVISFCEDREGTLWIGTNGGGLLRFQNGRFTAFTTANGLSSNYIRAIYEDREGILWLGTFDNGLMRMTPQLIKTYSEKDGLVHKTFYPILQDRAGDIWIGNDGVNRFSNGAFKHYPLKPPPPYPPELYSTIRSMLVDNTGRLLLAGVGHGLAVIQGEKISYEEKGMAQAPLAIFQDRQGAFWFGFNGRLLREKDGIRQWFDSKDGLKGIVQPIYEDRQGRLWIGTYGGLANFVDGRFRFFTEQDGLSSNRIRAIYEDSDGVLWIGTYDGGLNRFKDGRFLRFTTAEGMYSNGIFSILEDRRGNFWMGSNQGIHRVPKQQLNDFADGKVIRIDAIGYGKADGMLSAECNGGRHPSALKARDGRMWFPTLNGVAVIDPEAVTFNATPPPVVIESVTLDRDTLDFHQPIVIQPGQTQLEISYAGLSFIKPEHVRFKYRMEGLDKDWIEVGTRRAAYFSHLPAGNYAFQVIAANSDGVWNQEGARLNVIVIPPLWQRWWFVALLFLSLMGFVMLLFRARLEKLKREQALQNAFSQQLLTSQEQERKRIAVGLHDSLGQQLLIIKNWAMIVLKLTGADHPSREGVNEISTTASQAIEEVREIIYDLRPYQLDKAGLASTIQFMVEKAAAASDIKFDIDIGEIDNLLPYDSEILLYRVVQECVNNILKHSQATAVRVVINRDERLLNLMIEDNGRGFSSEIAACGDFRRGGLGLSGMSERVRILGGKLTIQSAPGNGTKISITLDAGERHGR